MVNSFEVLNELLKSHTMTVADLEYIVRYLTNENISPQLAMRRIKSFEALKTKLEDTSSQDTITELEAKLEDKEKVMNEELAKKEEKVQQILDEKSNIENQKVKLENLSDLFESEREELKNQLKLLHELQETSLEPDDDFEGTSDLTVSLSKFNVDLHELVGQKSELSIYLNPIAEAIQLLIQTPHTYNFNKNHYMSSIPTARVVEKSSESQIDSKSIVSSVKTTKSEPITKKSTFSRPQPKKIKPGPSEKVLQVLNLFLDFVGEATTDKDFRNRVETICDMDEAYEHLGGIGLSQLYSFASKDISKKDEFIQLIDEWKVDGVPR